MWSDAIAAVNFPSTAANEFSARATGGVRFVSAINPSTGAPTAGVFLAPGGGAWSNLSDRASKERVQAVDKRQVLEKLVALPVDTWSYKTQSASVRHIGPMAQDFAATFGVGESERHINTVDASGVALAAIQGLHQVVQEKDARISALEQQTVAQQQQITSLESRLAALERGVTMTRN